MRNVQNTRCFCYYIKLREYRKTTLPPSFGVCYQSVSFSVGSSIGYQSLSFEVGECAGYQPLSNPVLFYSKSKSYFPTAKLNLDSFRFLMYIFCL